MYEESLALAQTIGDEKIIFDIKIGLVMLDDYERRYEACRKNLEEMLHHQRTRGDKARIADLLIYLGMVVASQFKFREAHAYYEESRTLFRQINDEGGIGSTLDYQGLLAEEEGDYARAFALNAESLIIAKKRGARHVCGVFFMKMGRCALKQNDFTLAQDCFEQSMQILRETAWKWDITYLLQIMSYLENLRGNPSEASRLLTECLTIYRELGQPKTAAMEFSYWVRHVIYQNNLKEAHMFLQASQALADESGDTSEIAHALMNSGILSLEEGDYETARRLLVKSLALQQESGSERYIALTIAGLSQLADVQQQSARIAKLHGVVSALLDGSKSIEQMLFRKERQDYENHVANARAALGETAFEHACAEGHALTLEQAIAYALEANDAAGTDHP